MNKPDPDFITITTSVYQKLEVTRAIIENLEREVMSLNNQLEYVKNIQPVVKDLLSMYTGLPNRQIFDTILDFCNSMGMNYRAGCSKR